jgi:hypothetical protein
VEICARDRVRQGGAEASNAGALQNLGGDFLELLGREAMAALSADYEQGNRLDEVIGQTFDRIRELLELDEDTARALARFSEDSSVRLMTIHKCKGLEFDSVIVLGVEDQTFWSDLDAERSAYFVAISRAKRRLYLTVAERREWPSGAKRRWNERRSPQKEFLGYANRQHSSAPAGAEVIFLPANLDRVRLQSRVCADDRCCLDHGLGHKHPIEWIPMVGGKTIQGQDMLLDDCQDGHTVGLLLMGYDLGQRQPQVQLAQLAFDLDFPKAGDTENQLVAWVAAEGQCRRRELGRGAIPPDEGVGVQKELHSLPSQSSSGKGASKSAEASMLPGCNPGTRRAAKATRRARGVLPSVRTISVPVAACATRSANRS